MSTTALGKNLGLIGELYTFFFMILMSTTALGKNLGLIGELYTFFFMILMSTTAPYQNLGLIGELCFSSLWLNFDAHDNSPSPSRAC
ncbi:hypothetical protein [Amphritea sp.]|uniref:hypothetical protein n=1 Tax=Amphritea sp. TaxID=1872502 RepID=UPI003A90318F